MEFLAILVALAVLQLRGGASLLQYDGWFQSFRRLLPAGLGGAARQAVLLLVPALAVWLLQRAVDGRFYGLAELVLFVVALLYAFGRGNVAEELTDYLQRWSRGDFQAAFEQLSTDVPGADDVQDTIVDPQALHASARRWLYYRSFERILAVLFWFFLLGPAGAVVYRVAVLERDAARLDAQPTADSRLLHWLDWLPSRLAGISFALVGHFDECLYAWQRVLGEAGMPAADALEQCGNAALAFAVPAEEEAADALIARGSRELQAVENLYGRALLVWLVIMAALAMIF